MDDGKYEPAPVRRLPSYPLTVGALAGLFVFSFMMAAINVWL